MCIRDSGGADGEAARTFRIGVKEIAQMRSGDVPMMLFERCLLYTSDAADERSSVDFGGRRIIKKKKKIAVEGILRVKYTMYSLTDDDIQCNKINYTRR